MSISIVSAVCSMANGASEGEHLTHTVANDISWNALPDGRATAAIHGDMQSGEHISYVRFPPGMRTATHTHSNTYVGIIVKGTARHFEPQSAESEIWLPPGSFYRVPAGVAHVSECSSGSECIFAIHQHGPFDRSLVD